MLAYSKQAIQIDKPSLNYFNTNTSFSLTIRSGNNLNNFTLILNVVPAK